MYVFMCTHVLKSRKDASLIARLSAGPKPCELQALGRRAFLLIIPAKRALEPHPKRVTEKCLSVHAGLVIQKADLRLGTCPGNLSETHPNNLPT